ncbi:MAG: hypothetical protein ACK502_02615 [Alphaproteobacteria bacterium]
MHHHRSHAKQRSLAMPLLAVLVVVILVCVGAALFVDPKPAQQLVEKELDAKTFLSAQQ